MRARELAIQAIEVSGRSFWDSGKADDWFSSADRLVHRVSKTINGPELQRLARHTSAADPSCPDIFRHGAALIGVLPRSGLGVERDFRFTTQSMSCETAAEREIVAHCQTG